MKNKLFYFSLLVLFFILVVTSCNSGGGSYTVRYEITGPQAIANQVSWYNETANMDSITNVPIPWEKTITVQGRYISVGCLAVIYPSNGSTYTAKIFVNGREYKTASSSSGSVTVTGVID